MLPFTLNFTEDGEEKEAAKGTSWRNQSEEDARVRVGIKEDGGWGGNRGRAKDEKKPCSCCCKKVLLFNTFRAKGLGMTQKVVGELGKRRASLRNMVGRGCVEVNTSAAAL